MPRRRSEGSPVVAAHPYPLLLSPFEIRGRRLRNRIVSTPHATGWSRDGLIDRSEVDYHVRKAAGGCGLVMTFGSASVDPSTEASYGSIALWDERNEPALRALADGVHEHGGLVMSQMTHMGRRGTSVISGIPLRAPSDLPEGVHMEVPVPLATDELPAIVERFADVARRLERCGLDGVEVTSFGGHLIEQFFDPLVNTRTDAYGGSLENRTRFAREVLLAVRAAVSDRFIVGFRMAVDQCLTGGLGPDEMIEIARSLASTGAVDLFSVSGGTGATRLSTGYFVPGDALPEGVYNERAIRFRREVGVPTLVAGRNVEPAMAESVAGRPGSSSSAMTRAIIADPDLPLKIADGRRHRPCIGLNDGCIGRLYTGMPTYCSVNPAIWHSGLAHVVPAEERPASWSRRGGRLEAARAAALRGHEVVFFERRPVLGGRFSLAGHRSGRDCWHRSSTGCSRGRGGGRRYPRGRRRGRSGRPGRKARRRHRRDGIGPPTRGAAAGPSACARRRRPARGRRDHPSRPVVGFRPDPGRRWRATGADRGRDVGRGGLRCRDRHDPPRGCRPIDATQLPFVLRRLARDGVQLTPNVCGVASSLNAVTLRHLYTEADERRAEIALVVIAGRRKGLTTLRDDLAAAAPDLPLAVVGDALSPRTLMDATAEGARAGATV